MDTDIAGLLLQKKLTSEDIMTLLSLDDDESRLLFKEALRIKEIYLGSNVYLSGLIEYSNVCGRNCLYCGKRKENAKINRFILNDQEVIEAAISARRNNYASIIIQGGSVENHTHSDKIASLIDTIITKTNNELKITLSLGEQEREVYRRWYEAGADGYILRIESSGKKLYEKIHPNDGQHNYDRRHDCLRIIKETGYKTGTGVIIGLPHQTLRDLAGDIEYVNDLKIDTCSMGPFIEHSNTPFGNAGKENFFLKERFGITLRMIAVLRVVMKKINIIAAPSMLAVDLHGRDKALLAGANIITPNMTPLKYCSDYQRSDKQKNNI